MSNTWKYMNRQLDPNELPTMQELLTEIDENGGTDAALASVREREYEKYHNELIWRYPISQGDSAGGFIMPVREGILWIPYDEMEKEAGEILRTNDATIMDEETCAQLRDDFRRYADELCAALKDCARICRKIGRGKYIEETINLGSFEMVSDRMAVSDPCYDTDVWCRGELENVLPGIWEASVIKRDEGDWGRRVARLIAVHEDYTESDIEATENAEFEVGVDSGQAGLFDCLHYRDDRAITGSEKAIDKNDSGALWCIYCCHITLTQMAAGVLPYGVVSSSGFGDRSYDCFYGRNDDEFGVIVMKEKMFSVVPGSEGSKDYYYSNSDREPFCIGHIRGDFGKSGDEYWATFWEHEGIKAAGEGSKEELTALVNTLRKNLLKGRKAMRKYIQQHPPLIIELGEIMSYGYQVTTEKYDFFIRCSPYPGIYDFYIYMYIREV